METTIIIFGGPILHYIFYLEIPKFLSKYIIFTKESENLFLNLGKRI
jgi:hypothetical protein